MSAGAEGKVFGGRGGREGGEKGGTDGGR